MRLFIALIAILAFVFPAFAAERFDDPVKLVEFIYGHYGDGTYVEFDQDAYWSPRMAELIAVDEARGELGSLTFDPFINSQEDFLGDLSIAQVSADASTAVIAVTFDNGGGPQTSNFTLVSGAEGWKIDEIEGVTPDRLWKLSDILAQPL